MNSLFLSISISIMAFFSCSLKAQTSNDSVKISGAMKNVMKGGVLEGTILLDTIHNKNALYGLGPLDYLKGELLIINGNSYIATVNNDNSVSVEKSFKAKAPFFVYKNAENLREYAIPESVSTLPELEIYLYELTKNNKHPFVFRLTGTFAKVSFHIVNLPDGAVVKSPEDAHRGQQTYNREQIHGDIVGFFSTEHKGIFTHHDTYMHLHFITSDRTEMGHLDSIEFEASKVKLLIEGE